MAIRHKRKNSSGYTWQTGDLVEGQIGLNIADGTLHFDKADGTTVTIGSSSGITDIVQDTTPQLGGDLDVNGHSIVSTSNSNITITPNGTGSVVLDGNTFPQIQGGLGEVLTADGSGLVEWKLPQTLSTQVYNADSVTINKGEPVYVYGVNGTNISVKRALNTSDSTSAQTIGLANEDISAGSTGIVICQGLLKNVDTSAYSAGATLYLGSTAGSKTSTKPYAPNHLVYLGFVETVNSTSGRIYVRAQNGYELDEIHDANIGHNVTLNNGDVLTYNSSNSLWENRPPAYQGTVTSVSGSAPISVATGTTTPAISISQSSTSTNGYLSSTDWTTFNGKQDALVSGTNIKTINSTSILGSGNISVTATPAGSNQQVQYNNNGALGASSGFYYDGVSLKVTSGNIESLYSSGDEGGEFRLATATTNTTLAGGSIAIDIYQNKLRIFETGGNTRGVYLDLTTAANSVGSSLAVQGTSASFTALTSTTNTTLKDIRETVYAIGNSSTNTLTPDAANGTVQTITATGNFTLSAFSNPVSGQTITFIITQDGTGSRTLTSTMKFAGGSKTLSTAASAIDILTVSYIGTTYYASLAKGFA